MIIPANAKEVDLAHKWINFMLENEVALKNTI
jgi:spermidine/putrescine-binding protein